MVKILGCTTASGADSHRRPGTGTACLLCGAGRHSLPAITAAKTPTVRHRREPGRTTAATDRRIDHLVYELYDLTGEEIKIVEEATT